MPFIVVGYYSIGEGTPAPVSRLEVSDGTAQLLCRSLGHWARKDYGRVASNRLLRPGNGSSILGLKAPVSVTSSPSSAARNDLSRRVRPSEQRLDQRSHLCNPVSAPRFSRTTADPAPGGNLKKRCPSRGDRGFAPAGSQHRTAQDPDDGTRVYALSSISSRG